MSFLIIYLCTTYFFTSKTVSVRSGDLNNIWASMQQKCKWIQAFKTNCLKKPLRTSYLEHTTNDWVWNKINFLMGPQEPLLPIVKRQKLAQFGYVMHYTSLFKTILQSTLEVWVTPWSAEEMLVRQCQREDIPAHARTAYNGLPQKRLEEDLCWIVPHVPPMTKSVKGLNWIEQHDNNNNDKDDDNNLKHILLNSICCITYQPTHFNSEGGKKEQMYLW